MTFARDCSQMETLQIQTNTSRPAIAGKQRCSVYKLWQKYKCEKRASNISLSYCINVDKWSFDCFTSLCLYL